MKPSVESVKKQLFDIWTEAGVGDHEWVPLVPHALKEGCVLFVGMNPSFSKRGWKQVVEKGGGPHANPFAELAWGNRDSLDVRKWTEIEENSLKTHSYFRVFNAFGNATGCSWDHIDLFQYRHTNQREAEGRLLESTDPLKLTPFGDRQLAVSLSLIEQCQPRAIVVVNALGSRIMREARHPVFDSESGCHWLSINGPKVPVFFSSMLTGQRALDVFSRLRLFWHVSQVLDMPFPAEAWDNLGSAEPADGAAGE